MKTNENACPRCGCHHVKKNGTTAQGKQRYRCKVCGRQFLFVMDYGYRACNPLYRELIVPMTLNGSGIRDTARVLQISPNTVLHVLRESADQTPEPTLPMHSGILDLSAFENWRKMLHRDSFRQISPRYPSQMNYWVALKVLYKH